MRVGFCEFRFDGETRRMERRAEEVHLTPKALRLLKILLEERPRAVRKEIGVRKRGFEPNPSTAVTVYRDHPARIPLVPLVMEEGRITAVGPLLRLEPGVVENLEWPAAHGGAARKGLRRDTISFSINDCTRGRPLAGALRDSHQDRRRGDG